LLNLKRSIAIVNSLKVKHSVPLKFKFSRQSVAISVAALALLIAGLWWAMRDTSRALPPNLQVTTLDSKTFDVTNSAAPLLITFWATTCAICIQEMPRLEAFQAQLKAQGVKVLSIAMPYDRPQSVLEFAKSRGHSLNYVLDLEGKLNKTFGGVVETPTAMVVHHGRIIKTIRGEPRWQELHDYFKKLS
jgi:thiol-disulfide isomerase/thioredoxin